MENKSDFIAAWKSQSVPERKTDAAGFMSMANSRVKFSATQHLLTISVLVTTLLLLFFFLMKSGYSSLLFHIGIGLMMIALVLRIAFEFYSYHLLKRNNAVAETLIYLHQIASYFRKRKRIHQPYTIITVVLYASGVILLMPDFYRILSTSFFIYILISFVVALVILVFFIRKKVQRELAGFKEIIIGLEKTIASLSKEN